LTQIDRGVSAPYGDPRKSFKAAGPKSRLKVFSLNTLHTFDGGGGPHPGLTESWNRDMANPQKSPTKIIIATVVILVTVAYLAFSGARDNKSYYVTIGELQGMGDKAYVRHLRVAGNVAPGSIHRVGTNATFDLLEQGRKLSVVYQGSEPPPDTFKDDAQALAVGTYSRDGVFHATELQAKCASKYAPAPATTPATTATALPATH
jgi:cytochrome c-type biogenesis protein CcmE